MTKIFLLVAMIIAPAARAASPQIDGAWQIKTHSVGDYAASVTSGAVSGVFPIEKGGTGTQTGISTAAAAQFAALATSTTTASSVKASTGTCASPTFPRTLNSGGLLCVQPSNVTGNAATVTTNANLTGPVTSVGNATTIASPLPALDGSALTNLTPANVANGTFPVGVVAPTWTPPGGSTSTFTNDVAFSTTGSSNPIFDINNSSGGSVSVSSNVFTGRLNIRTDDGNVNICKDPAIKGPFPTSGIEFNGNQVTFCSAGAEVMSVQNGSVRLGSANTGRPKLSGLAMSQSAPGFIATNDEGSGMGQMYGTAAGNGDWVLSSSKTAVMVWSSHGGVAGAAASVTFMNLTTVTIQSGIIGLGIINGVGNGVSVTTSTTFTSSMTIQSAVALSGTLTQTGSGLVDIRGTGGLSVTNQILAKATMTVQGAAFSVGVSTFIVQNGGVSISTNQTNSYNASLFVSGKAIVMGTSTVAASQISEVYDSSGAVITRTSAGAGASGGNGGIVFQVFNPNTAGTNALSVTQSGVLTTGGTISSGNNLTVAGNATVSGNSFTVGTSSFTVGGGSATVAYGLTAQTLTVNGASSQGGTTINASGALTVAASQAVNLSGANGNVVSGASVTASAFFGDGSHLSGISASEGGYFATTKTFGSSVTVSGTAFSVNGADLAVSGGLTGVGTASPAVKFEVSTGANRHMGITSASFMAGSGGMGIESYRDDSSSAPFILQGSQIYLRPQGNNYGVSVGHSLGGAVQDATTDLTVYGVITSSTTQGTVSCTAGTPVLSATTTDQHGTFTAGSLATACTYTFGTAWPKTPDCICQGSIASINVANSAVSKTALTCTGASAITGDTITYICFGAP